jgi:valyl-tRNA synthetase
MKKEVDSIMVADFPSPDEQFDDEEVASEMGLVIEIITAIRNIRGEMNIPPAEQIEVILRLRTEEDEKRIERNQLFIQNLAKIKRLVIGKEIGKPSFSAFAQVQDVEIFAPMGRSRMEEEARRLQKEILKIEKDIAFVNNKLSNEQFLLKAPTEVVDQEREKASEYLIIREKLEENLRKVKETLSG